MPKSAPIPSVFRSTNTNDNTQQSQSQTRPLTLSELADRASKASKAIPFSNSVPINRYIAGAESLKQQANAYQREKRNEDQFICLVKCARLLVELLPTHHGWHETNEETRKRVRKEGQAALDSLSALKSAQHDLFEAWRLKNPNVSLEEVQPSSSFGVNPSPTPSSSTTSISSNRLSKETSSPQDFRNQKEPSIQTLLGRNSNRPDLRTSNSNDNNNIDVIDFKQPEKNDGLFGFDVRNILGFGGGGNKASSSSSSSSPTSEIPYNVNRNKANDFGFDSSTISSLSSQMATLGGGDPYGSSTRRIDDNIGVGGDTFRYPTLNPSKSVRMSKHQETQGFAPSSNQTARYYQTITHQNQSQRNREIHVEDTYHQLQMPSVQHYNQAKSDYPSISNNRPSLPTPPHLTSHNPTLMPTPLHQTNSSHPSSSSSIYSNPYPLPPGIITSPTSTITASKPQPGPSIMSSGGSVTSQASQLMGNSIATSSSTTKIQEEISTARTESGVPLRLLLIPSELIDRFMELARRNTEANKETCGLLMGKLQNNVLKVNHLLLPQQTSDSDSCTTHSEEDIFLHQEKHSVSVFSWIHTHPSQSCFLSSLDLHTHASYQSMLPEAIAIVVSPKSDPNLGLFRLTDGPGLEIILNCKDPNSFHPHLDSNGGSLPLYTDAIFGHVRLVSGDLVGGLEVTDLRK